MEQRKDKIIFFKEKKWIMAYWFKRNRKCGLTENSMWMQWQKWWKEDCFDINDERFKDTFAWVKDTVATMPINEIKKKRYDMADTRQVSRALQRKAISKGYFIKRSATSRHPYVVSGYMICSSKGKKHNHIICGEKYNLTLKQVNEFLERKEDKKNEND